MKKIIAFVTIILAIFFLIAADEENLWRDLNMHGYDILNANVSGVTADHIISDTSDLHAIFPDSIDNGEVILFEKGTYRSTEWLELNSVSGVRIIGQGYAHPDSFGVLIKPADSVEVGGFKIGTSGQCRNILIEGIGFDGNYANLDSTVAHRCHAFHLDSVEYVTIRGNYIRNTFPHDWHNEGGSGIIATRNARYVLIENNQFYDTGDRDMSLGGDYITVRNNIAHDGYDRMVSLQYVPPSDDKVYAGHTIVEGNKHFGNRTNGSVISAANDASLDTTEIGYWIIRNNFAKDSYRAFIKFGLNVYADTTVHVVIDGNEAIGTNAAHEGIIIGPYAGASDNCNVRASITNNYLYDFGLYGIKVRGDYSFVVSGNQINKCAGGIYNDGPNSIVSNNHIDSSSADAIKIYADLADLENIIVTNNIVRNTTGDGIIITEGTGDTLDYYIIRDNIIRGSSGSDINDGGSGSNKNVTNNL